MTTTQSRASFRDAILSVLNADRASWPQPIIYAEHIGGDKFLFGACNAPARPSDSILWLAVEEDSFGDPTGDNEADADAIEDNLFEQAINDVNDSFFF
jgi:hypothetical protein